MSRAQLLYRLQLLDSELDQAKKQLAEINAALGESESLRRARAAVDAADAELREAHANVQNLDLEVSGLAEKIARQEKLLYSGKSMSAKEAANLQEEVTSLKRWRRQREELLLEAMVAAEEAEAKLSEAEASLSSVEAEWKTKQGDLLQQKRVLQEKIAELEAQRPTLVEAIADEDLQEYEALRRRKGGRAVAVIKDGVCQGCGVAASNSKIQKARAGVELVYCSTCGRILYAP